MKKIKWIMSLASTPMLVTPITLMTTTSCSQTEYIENEVPMLDSDGKTEILKTKIMFRENSSIAYISFDNALELVKTLHAKFGYDNVYDYSITKNNGIYTATRENGSTLTIDTWFNTLTFSDYSKFISYGSNKVSSLICDYGPVEPYTSDHVKFLAYGSKDTRIRSVNQTVIYLSNYDISVIERNNTVYIPLQTVSDLLLNYIIQPVFAIKNAIIPATTLKVGKDGQKTAYPAYIADNKLEINDEFLKFAYNEVCLWLDLEYGLKKKKSITCFDDIFKSNSYDSKKTLKEYMLSSVDGFDNAINWLVGNVFDDGHSNFMNNSIYSNQNYKKIIGESVLTRQYITAKFASERHAIWPTSESAETFPQYLEITSSSELSEPDFAYITFDKFNAIPENFDQSQIPESPFVAPRNNAIALFTSAYKRIKENTNIKNVVVDISNNSGGDGRFCVWLASVLCGGEITVPFRATEDNTINMCSFYADADLNNKITDDDKVLSSRNVYILTSPKTFSCGNILPTITQNQNNIKIIGQRTGGGSCVVNYGCSALGTYFRISGPIETGYIHNGTFIEADDGILPSYYIDESSFYGPKDNPRENITKIITDHQK